MSQILMRGVTDIRNHISSHLSVEMPLLIDVAREQWSMPEHLLPYPKVFDSYDPLKVDNGQFPSVGSHAVRTPRLTRVDISDTAEEEYIVRYTMRVFVWVRTPYDETTQAWVAPEYDSCLKQRDDLGAILRASLLRWPSLGTAGADRPLLKVEETSLTEEYFDAIPSGSQNDRWMAGMSITVDIDSTESTYHEPIGTADTIHTDVGVLPRHHVGN